MKTYSGVQDVFDIVVCGDDELAKEALSQSLDRVDKLTRELTSIRTLYAQATYNHPDDEVRKVAMDHSQALLDDTFDWMFVTFEMEDF